MTLALVLAGTSLMVGRVGLGSRRRRPGSPTALVPMIRAASLGLVVLGAAAAVAAAGAPTATHPVPVSAGFVPGVVAPLAPVGREASTAGANRHSATLMASPLTTAVVPERIDIPRLGVDASVAPVTTDSDGALGVPADPSTVGWWAQGAQPGAATGTSVFDSHVNFGGRPGAFAGLSAIVPGDVIDVHGSGGARTFVVTGLREYPKTALPWGSVFAAGSDGRLALVTCGGSFDPATGHYADNVVVFAAPTGSSL